MKNENLKTIVVTGGAGFIGSNLIETLLKGGKSMIISLDNYSTGKKENHITGAEYIEGDTKDIEKLISIKPDLVFHLGEYSRVEKSFDDIKKAKKIIISHNKNTKLDKGYILALSPLEAVKMAEKLMCKEAVLSAGPNLTKDFFKEKLINEMIINIDPISIGTGIKLFQENNSDIKLSLVNVNKLDGKIVQLHYKVVY